MQKILPSWPNAEHVVINSMEFFLQNRWNLVVEPLPETTVQPFSRRSLFKEAQIQTRSVRGEFVTDKVALGQTFSEYFGFLRLVTYYQWSILIRPYITMLHSLNNLQRR